MKDFDGFISTFDSSNTGKIAKSMSSIGEFDYSNCTPVDIEKIILDMKPNSPKSITTICYIFGLYAQYIENEDLFYMVKDIDRNVVWLKAKPNASKKFISHSNFENIYHEIGVYEEYNSFYIQTLFRCLYEGIYNDDLSVIKNLRASDINDNIVTLRNDNGEEYTIEITDQLSRDLKELGKINTWSRRNRYGECKINTTGLYEDSCFKVENRKGTSEYSYRFTYYRILRKIAKEYLEYNLLPLQLYVSGIMHRINLKLNERDIDLYEAFSNGNKDRNVSKIIANELSRSNYDVDVRNFREMVKGHLEVFHS